MHFAMNLKSDRVGSMFMLLWRIRTCLAISRSHWETYRLVDRVLIVRPDTLRVRGLEKVPKGSVAFAQCGVDTLCHERSI